jgi:hypothetical protein
MNTPVANSNDTHVQMNYLEAIQQAEFATWCRLAGGAVADILRHAICGGDVKGTRIFGARNSLSALAV